MLGLWVGSGSVCDLIVCMHWPLANKLRHQILSFNLFSGPTQMAEAPEDDTPRQEAAGTEELSPNTQISPYKYTMQSFTY